MVGEESPDMSGTAFSIFGTFIFLSRDASTVSATLRRTGPIRTPGYSEYLTTQYVLWKSMVLR